MKSLLLTTLSLALGLASQAAEKPNIVLIIADDCTFRDIGCYGGQAHTPNIDKLATEGMRFERCFQAAPMCSPTRHNIYTGLYPVTSGAYPNHTFAKPQTKSVVHYLKDLGYRVGLSGKSHVAPKKVFNWEVVSSPNTPDFDKIDGFISDSKKANQPFCLLICSPEPHSPWNQGDPSQYPPSEIKLPPYHVDTPQTREGMSNYLAEITYFDGEVGKAAALIEEHGLASNTLFILISEQGNGLPFAKWTCYDSGLQSAFIARWPGKIEAGSVNPAMIEYVDILPTFVEAAGGTPDPILQGKSLIPVFAGKQNHKEFVFGIMTTRGIHSGSDHFGIRSVRSEKFKYIWNLTPEAEFKNIAMNGPEFKSWEALAATGDKDATDKVKRYKIRPEIELYDIVNDPLELNNLAQLEQYSDIKRELRVELDAWMKSCGDKGQETEMTALERKTNSRRKKVKK